jgi:nitroreductase
MACPYICRKIVMDILEALNWRYATKSFDNQLILSEEQIHLLKEAFNLTPTSYGLQPLKLMVISDKKLQEKLFEVSYRQEQVKTASHVFVICIEKPIDRDFIVKHFDLIKQIRETPDEVLQPYRDFLINDFSKKTNEDLRQWAMKQAYLALGNMLTTCALTKIDACPMEGFQPDKYAEILNLETDTLEPVLVLPVGQRDKSDKFASFKKVRRPLNEVILEV